jgi:hypothetical protein
VGENKMQSKQIKDFWINKLGIPTSDFIEIMAKICFKESKREVLMKPTWKNLNKPQKHFYRQRAQFIVKHLKNYLKLEKNKSKEENKCQCNLCRLFEYNNPDVSYAYFVGYSVALTACIEDMKRNGYKRKGIASEEDKNISCFETDLATINTLLYELVKAQKPNLVLLGSNGEEIK